MKSWYVVKIQPNQARRLESRLIRRGIVVFNPQEAYIYHVCKATYNRTRPLFPGYFFIHCNLFTFFLATINLPRIPLLDFGHGPVTVPEDVIDDIKSRLDSNDVYYKPKPKYKRFKRGQPVFIESGVWSGRPGFVVSDDGQRVQVTMEGFGGQQDVTFERPIVTAVYAD